MLQQPSSAQHQRIGGGGGAAHPGVAAARVRSRASSRASSTARVGRDVTAQASLKTDDDDARTEWSVDEGLPQAQPQVAIPQVGFPPRPAQYAKKRDVAAWSAAGQVGGERTSAADHRAQNFEPPAVSLVYPQGSMFVSMFLYMVYVCMHACVCNG